MPGLILNTNTRRSIMEKISDYTVVDLETTGISPKKCEIIEMSAVKVRGGIITEEYSTLVRPHAWINSFITSLTGITNEMVKDAPRIEEALPEYIEFIGDDIIVGHNVAAFDRNIIKVQCENLGLPEFCNDCVDTCNYSRHCDIDVPDHKLTTLTKYFGIGHENAHRALADCIANYECYERLKELYTGKKHTVAAKG